MDTTNLEREITAILDQLCDCWNACEPERVRALWDTDEPTPYAMPQEIEAPLIGWEALDGYFARARARLEAASMRVWDVHSKLLAPDLAVALYQMHWNGLIKGFDKPMGVDTRVTAIFRRRSAGWRICHYVEAPPAPMLHLQQRYAAAVDAAFLRIVGNSRG